MQQMIFIADLIACSTCLGYHYAHHQELENIIQEVAACRIWCLVFKLSVWYATPGSIRSPQLHIQVMYQSRYTAQNSWWWAERLPETC